MKRIDILLLLLLSAMVLSCKKEVPTATEGESDAAEPILVGAIPAREGKWTKNNIIYDYASLIASGKPLSLYSYAKYEGYPYAVSVLANAKLEYSAGSWTYKPLQYWVKSASEYGFFAAFPYVQSRLDPNFRFPTQADEWMLGTYPNIYPIYETWSAEDYAHGNIVRKESKTLYLTVANEDIMFGGSIVSPSSFGESVDIPVGHATCAVRFSVRNLSEKPFALTNWYMTGLKNHADMSIYIIDCPEEDPMRFMTLVEDIGLDSVKISSFGETGVPDMFKRTGEDWTYCAEYGDVPGGENYYRYVMLSSPLKELGSTFGLTHSHSADGKTIIYKDGSGTEWTDPKKFMEESTVYKSAVATVSAPYAQIFKRYGANIFWGPAHYLDADNFFMPAIYKRGVTMIDFNMDGSRGNQGDVDLGIHQFECRSHMFKISGGWKANGGIYMPVHSDYLAHLYSPYFLNAESHGAVQGDWKAGMSTDRWNQNDPNFPYGKQRSVFLWTADTLNPTYPARVDTCITNMNAVNSHYTPSVKGGDLATVLNDWGYILMYPQTLENLVFNFYTCTDSSGKGDPKTATYVSKPEQHSFNVKNYTPGGEWLPGYTYNYIITVSSSAISMTVDVQPWNEREIDLK